MNKFFPSGIQTQNNNIETQTFDPNLTHNVSMVSGFDGVHENLVVVDAAGNLHVNSASSSYLNYYSTYFVTTTVYTPTVNVTFPKVVSYVMVSITNSAGQFSFVDTITGQLGTMLWLDPGTYVFPITTTGMAYYSGASGTSTGVCIIGYY
jgi:hypothetical protein